MNLPVTHHSFPLFQMLLSVLLYSNINLGFRPVAGVFNELSNFFQVKPVCYNTVRSWILRLSFGLLFNCKIEKRDDWIYIIDFSNQVGSQRCLLILAVAYEHFKNNNFILQHKDMTVVDIYVKDRSNSALVTARIKKAIPRTGVPYQFISDGGGDVIKGIRDFIREQNVLPIQTGDITHKIGLHLKHLLEPSLEWDELSTDLRSIAQRTKQSDAAFLRPVSLRKKAKWLNIDRIYYWLKNIFDYREKGDFNLLEKNFGLTPEFVPTVTRNKTIQKQLLKKNFDSIESAKDYISEINSDSKIIENVKLKDLGEEYFTDKFGTIEKHNKFSEELGEMITMADTIKKEIKTSGLSSMSIEKIKNIYKTEGIKNDKSKILYQKILQTLNEEIDKFPDKTVPQLCCSDIIESVFGKFKVQLTNAVGGIYSTVLNIVLICTDLTIDQIPQILAKTKLEDVENWFLEMSGRSIQAKRNEAFKHEKKNKTCMIL
ncbi:MAG: hypothetical protein KAI79_18720 [Bacteroidales bacterium]|nr:hypothetical protein [Bacteroidales bacterium]